MLPLQIKTAIQQCTATYPRKVQAKIFYASHVIVYLLSNVSEIGLTFLIQEYTEVVNLLITTFLLAVSGDALHYQRHSI